MDQETLTVSYTVVVKPEPSLSAQDKEAAVKQTLQDVAIMVCNMYDYGISVEGTVASTASETANVDESKPDYEE